MIRTHMPRIVVDIQKASYKLASVQVDKERLCYFVSDDEWNEIVEYAGRF